MPAFAASAFFLSALLRKSTPVIGAVALAAMPGAALAARPAAVASVQQPSLPHEIVTDPLYDGGIKGKWQDQGWAPRDTAGQAARIDFSNLGGWILVRRGSVGPSSALIFRIRAPQSYGNFLEVSLGSVAGDNFPHVAVESAHLHASQAAGGWVDVRVPLSELNPKGLSYDRVTVRARRAVPAGWVELAGLAFVSPADSSQAVAHRFDTRRVSLRVNCQKPSFPISPGIYGIAFNPRKNQADSYQWRLAPTARRWGGNPASRYNWRLGNAWNTAADWFFMNVNYTGVPNYSWQQFLDENRRHGVQTALTVPMLGWVAKDTQSYSYPTSIYGQQRGHFGSSGDVGNGIAPNGQPLPGSDPRRTSIAASPAFVGSWVEAIRRYDQDTGNARSVGTYFLDNEPSLWNSTHHDVHPDPVTYDELLQRTLAYGSEVRRADPEANIAGPSEWGWPAYFFSAKDAASGFTNKPDRLAHNDAPLLAWYLQQLREHESHTGERLLNTLDVHYYPEGEGVHGAHEGFDETAAARRVRATRSLWDPTYKDESWIADRIRLIPRLHALVSENYPGTKVSLGEYNFGGEHHISGALAQAEALGRFAQERLDAAYYWTYPPENSAVYHAFRAFRDYDGKGAHFLDRYVPTTEDIGTSLFASTDASGTRVVAIALNLDAHEGAEADLDLTSCGEPVAGRTFQYLGGQGGLQPLDASLSSSDLNQPRRTLPPYSITVFEFDMAQKH